MIRFHSLTLFAANIFLPNSLQRKLKILGDPRYAGLSRDAQNSVDAVSGCFMLARRDVLDHVGGLDTRFFMYGEEAEWCHRCHTAGWDIVYNPEIEILHHGAASTAHMSKWKAVEMTRGHILFLRFTRGAFIAWIGTLLMAIRDLVRAPYYVITTLMRGLNPPAGAKSWWARLKFLLGALSNLPEGQTIFLPDADSVKK